MSRILSSAIVLLAIFGNSSISLAQGMSSFDGPGRYEIAKTYMGQIQTDFPSTVRMEPVGQSDSGETIWAMAIGSGPIHNLVVATHHGNEYGSTEVALRFARFMAANPIPNQTMYVIPVLNIPGYNLNRREETAHGRSFDPNRDYPGPCGSDGPHNLSSTSALARFVDEKNIVASATLHTFQPAVVFPWGFATQDLSTAYDSEYLEMARQATMESRYEIGNSSEVIYPANGCYEDYVFWKHGIWSLLFELGNSHSPNDSAIETMVAVNVPGLYRFFQNAPTARAVNHAFTGQCDHSLKFLDRRDE